MSAYICGPQLFVTLGLYGSLNAGSYLQDANETANLLYQENIRSVKHRYPRVPDDQLPGPIDRPAHITVKSEDRLKTVAAMKVLRLCDELEYQSCETPDYYQTEAFMALHLIRKAAVRNLPGYAD